MQYEVTIGIPVYESVDYIQQAVESALNQTFSSIEYLIVDDCGHDGAMDIVNRLQQEHPRGKDIRILQNDQNRGVSFCRNRIIDEAQGAFLYFMDSDDTIEPHTIELLYHAIITHEVQIAYASYDIIDGISQGPTQIFQKASLVLKGEDELAMYAFKNNHVFHVSVCNFLIDLLYLRQTRLRFIKVDYWEDMAFTTELVTMISKAVLLSEVTYHYLRRTGSLSHYQHRCLIDKHEIDTNIEVIDYLKQFCFKLKGKPYLSFLCYNLEINSFYITCYIIKYSHQIVDKYSLKEIQRILWHPLQLSEILLLNQKQLPNLFFYFVNHMPSLFFLPLVRFTGRLKGVYK